MNITLSQKKLRDGAQRLKTYLADKDITRNGKPIGANFCQQLLTVGLLDKPLEEVLKLLGSTTPATQNINAGVLVLSYGSDHVLVYRHTDADGTKSLQYYTSRAIGTDMEITEDAIYAQADTLAHTFNTTVMSVQLPEILHDDWEYEDIIALATAMRYNETSQTLLDVLTDTDKKIFINGHHANYGLSDEWFRELPDVAESLYDEGEPTFKDILAAVIAWMPEYTTEDHDLYEYFFSVDDLINATPVPNSKNTWRVEQKDANNTPFYVLVSLH